MSHRAPVLEKCRMVPCDVRGLPRNCVWTQRHQLTRTASGVSGAKAVATAGESARSCNCYAEVELFVDSRAVASPSARTSSSISECRRWPCYYSLEAVSLNENLGKYRSAFRGLGISNLQLSSVKGISRTPKNTKMAISVPALIFVLNLLFFKTPQHICNFLDAPRTEQCFHPRYLSNLFCC